MNMNEQNKTGCALLIMNPHSKKRNRRGLLLDTSIKQEFAALCAAFWRQLFSKVSSMTSRSDFVTFRNIISLHPKCP